MIVVAIIAIIAAIAIPGLLRARISANEGSSSAGLRSLASAQVTFAKNNSVDQDEDGTGEFGVFNEMAGITNRRGIAGGPVERPRLTTTDISVAFAATANSYSSKSGYYWQIFLPGDVGNIVSDNGTQLLSPLDTTAPAEDAAIQQQENRWIAYTWPATYRSSGIRCFVCDQGGDVFASANTDNNNAGYFFGDNVANRPTFDTAMDITVVAPDETDWQILHIKDNDPGNIVDPNHTWLPTGS
jgi:type II secretory pathway pseudopilin PulG